MQRLVVVGNGMVGHRFCERLVELGLARALRDHGLRRGAAARLRPRAPLRVLRRARRGRALAHVARLVRRARPRAPARPRRGGDRPRARARWSRRAASGSPTTRSCSRPDRRRSCRRFPASTSPGVFVYRTIEDLDAIRAWARERAARRGDRRRAARPRGREGGARPRARDARGRVRDRADAAPARRTGAALLRDAIEALGVHVHLGVATEAIVGDERVARAALRRPAPISPSTW